MDKALSKHSVDGAPDNPKKNKNKKAVIQPEINLDDDGGFRPTDKVGW